MAREDDLDVPLPVDQKIEVDKRSLVGFFELLSSYSQRITQVVPLGKLLGFGYSLSASSKTNPEELQPFLAIILVYFL